MPPDITWSAYVIVTLLQVPVIPLVAHLNVFQILKIINHILIIFVHKLVSVYLTLLVGLISRSCWSHGEATGPKLWTWHKLTNYFKKTLYQFVLQQGEFFSEHMRPTITMFPNTFLICNLKKYSIVLIHSF